MRDERNNHKKKIHIKFDTGKEREVEEWPNMSERKGEGGDKGMLGTKCSNPKPTSKTVTEGFCIVSVMGRGPFSYCDPAEWQQRSAAVTSGRKNSLC